MKRYYDKCNNNNIHCIVSTVGQGDTFLINQRLDSDGTMQKPWITYHNDLIMVTTVSYARTNEIGPRTTFVIASVRCNIHRNICIYLEVTRPRPTVKSKIITSTTV